ncbi:hypothetical protein AK812_SmicGene38721 [Symbiodinium microadriaticum]|uniref:Uncharacterized protein n=1 Tax=Symbiodinium microadriaticum TaxID=2951 RepID=A0A1Q9CD19_SYMMI|nr:hypothetical protein AK812_SmicGene38721 [Symbiodinium microadriaticum]
MSMWLVDFERPLPSLAVHPFVGSLPRRSTVWSHEISTYMTELEFNRTFFNVPDPRAPEKQRARSLPAMRGKLESADEAHRVNAIWRSYTRYVLQRLDDWRRT